MADRDGHDEIEHHARVLSCNQRRAEPDGLSQKSRTEAYVIERPAP